MQFQQILKIHLWGKELSLDPTIIAVILLTFLPDILVMEKNYTTGQANNHSNDIHQNIWLHCVGFHALWDFFSRISTNLKFIFAEES